MLRTCLSIQNIWIRADRRPLRRLRAYHQTSTALSRGIRSTVRSWREPALARTAGQSDSFRSRRKDSPLWLTINCGAFPRDLLESELFLAT